MRRSTWLKHGEVVWLTHLPLCSAVLSHLSVQSFVSTFSTGITPMPSSFHHWKRCTLHTSSGSKAFVIDLRRLAKIQQRYPHPRLPACKTEAKKLRARKWRWYYSTRNFTGAIFRCRDNHHTQACGLRNRHWVYWGGVQRLSSQPRRHKAAVALRNYSKFGSSVS